MITEKHKKEFTPFQIARYKKMIEDSSSVSDSFSDLHTKLNIFSHLDLKDYMKALELMVELDN